MTSKNLLHMFLLVLFFFSTPVYAQDKVTVRVGVGLSKPPYVIQKENRGVELEIVKRALEIAGYEFQPFYMPLLRIPHALQSSTIDAGMHFRRDMDHIINGYFSDEVISYQNYAITLNKPDIKIKTLEDLCNYKILAFQNANLLLGDYFKDVTRRALAYREISNQELQVRMLFAERTDVVISDFRIFLHFKRIYEKKIKQDISVKFHKIFSESPYSVVFKNEIVLDDFNKALKILRNSGEYDAIIDNYIPPHENL